MKPKGLTLKITVYIFIAVALIFGFIYRLNYTYSKRILENQIEQSAGYLRSSTVKNVENILSSIQDVPVNIAQSLENASFKNKDLKYYLQEMLRKNQNIFGVCIALEPGYYSDDTEFFAPYLKRDSSGFTFSQIGSKDYNYFVMDWYQLPKLLGKPCWSEPYFDKGGGNIIMSTYSVPLYKNTDTGKSFIGVVTADVSLDVLQKLISSLKVLETGYGILLSQSGRVVTHPVTEYIMNETIFSLAEESAMPMLKEVGYEMLGGKTGSLKDNFKNLRTGKESRIYYAPIIVNGWSLGIIYPEDELMADVTKLNKNVLYMAIAGLGLILLVVVLLSRNITRPIRQLTEAAQRFGSGEYNIELPNITTKDEIGYLNLTFGNMINELNRSIKELKDASDKLKVSNAKLEEYSQTLELKVEERTKEIKEKNSELQKTLEILKDTQNQLIMQEKMASLGGLTAGIAHEIKNPLNFVNNFSELSIDLMDELKEAVVGNTSGILDDINELMDDINLNLRKINEHGKRADSIVKGMLLHSRGKAGEMILTDINALLDEYAKLAYHGIRAQDASFNIRIETDFDNSLKEIKVVPQDISRVFLNIINNACYSANEKAKSGIAGFMPAVSVSSKNLGDKVEIRIKDNGKGISKENINKIFNPFFTTKPAGKGTGLGLSLSYDIIVVEHKGSIRVESEEGVFAEFIVTIPLNLN